MNRRDIVKLKFLIQQSYVWYGLIFQGPMMAYIFYKTSEIKWLAILSMIVGLILILTISCVWYKYFTPIEMEFNSNLNPEWRALREEVKR
jgi:hypothetical protein